MAKTKKSSASANPVVISGTKIATTWWGIAWNKNLELYADYANRIGRGRSYVRSGAVVDLAIDKGMISAKVKGSRRTPYNVEIHIVPLNEKKKKKILEQCSHRVENLSALAEGRFPDELKELFTAKGEGLFPSPQEIQFSCSCPDWAYMCKHVAAVLYGIGNRLDLDPLLFFALRDINVDDFIRKSVETKMENMLKNAGTKSPRVIEDDKVEELFGVL